MLLMDRNGLLDAAVSRNVGFANSEKSQEPDVCICVASAGGAGVGERPAAMAVTRRLPMILQACQAQRCPIDGMATGSPPAGPGRRRAADSLSRSYRRLQGLEERLSLGVGHPGEQPKRGQQARIRGDCTGFCTAPI